MDKLELNQSSSHDEQMDLYNAETIKSVIWAIFIIESFE